MKKSKSKSRKPRKLKLKPELQVEKKTEMTPIATLNMVEDLLTQFSLTFSANGEHRIVGRASEEHTIADFIEKCLLGDSANGLLYLCGKPGQGKTATLNQVLNDHFESRDDL